MFDWVPKPYSYNEISEGVTAEKKEINMPEDLKQNILQVGLYNNVRNNTKMNIVSFRLNERVSRWHEWRYSWWRLTSCDAPGATQHMGVVQQQWQRPKRNMDVRWLLEWCQDGRFRLRRQVSHHGIPHLLLSVQYARQLPFSFRRCTVLQFAK